MARWSELKLRSNLRLADLLTFRAFLETPELFHQQRNMPMPQEEGSEFELDPNLFLLTLFRLLSVTK
jgi:hypothetical protein